MTTTTQPPQAEDEVRQAAISRLRKKREFMSHLTVYVSVNLLINVVWWMTGPESFYWPVFPVLFWGIGVVMHAWDTYSPAMPSEAQIDKEIRRIRR
jgi:2TM domain-containing protein